MIPTVIPDYITHKQPILVFGNKDLKLDSDNGNTSVYIDGIAGIKQACRMVLLTELDDYVIYPDHDYGIETRDLYGKDPIYVKNKLERRIKDALSVDNRITDVTEYTAVIEKEKIYCEFIVHTTEGSFDLDYEFSLNET